ncbi:MAG: hypothetical protein PF569_04915 [Candidatus Woesearchaeota archaeon]|jgi:hypothetical protein|nr:hypothetical protein [Candidatus Woesearchaeota archaeon]
MISETGSPEGDRGKEIALDDGEENSAYGGGTEYFIYRMSIL